MRYSGSFGAASLLAFSVMLSACGGGGGSSNTGANSVGSSGDGDDVAEREVSDLLTFAAEPSDTALVLDQAQAEDVVAALLSALAQVVTLADEEGARGPFTDWLDVDELAGFDFTRLFAMQAGEFFQRDAQGFADGVTAVDCPLAGSSILELVLPESDSDQDKLIAGLQLNDCDFGDGLLLMGALAIEADGVVDALKAGLGVPANVALSFSASELSVHQADVGFTSDGRLDIDIGQSDDGLSLSIASPERFSYAGATSAMSLQRFSLNVDRDAAADTYRFAASGDMAINRPNQLNGLLTVTMPEPFFGNAGYYPDRGELLITGADNRQLTVLAGPAGELTISVDAGDGEAATVLVSSWDVLAATLARWRAER